MTEIVKAGAFYTAEDYHQDYYKTHSLRYKFYRYNSGRDQFLKKAWGAKATPKTAQLQALRAEVLDSFEQALTPVGLLDRYQIAGAVATWWGEDVFDLKTLMARGFEGMVEGWVTTIVTALEDEGSKGDSLDHKLVRRLLPEFLEEIAEAEAKVAELDGAIKAATASDEKEDDGEDEEEVLSEAEIKALKKERTAAKKKLKAMRQSFVERLEAAQAALDVDEAQELVLDLLQADLARELERRVAVHRQMVISVVEGWWDKYRVTLRSIEIDRDRARTHLSDYLRGLGYE